MTTSDDDAVRRIRAGDRDAFGVLVERYQGRLYGLALMMVRDPAGAEDVAQDAFVRAFLHLDQYDAARPFYPWLASIAVRLAQNWLCSRGRAVRRRSARCWQAKSVSSCGRPWRRYRPVSGRPSFSTTATRWR